MFRTPFTTALFAAFAVTLILLFPLSGCIGNGKPADLNWHDATPGAIAPDDAAPAPQDGATREAPGRSPDYSLNITREIRDGIMTTDTVFPELPSYDFNRTTQDGKLVVYYFYLPHCVASQALRPEMDRLEAGYDGVLWVEYDITTQNGSKAYQDFAGMYNLSVKERLVPQVLVNGTVITDRFNINSTLGSLIGNFSASRH
jgi:hypothetical protein